MLNWNYERWRTRDRLRQYFNPPPYPIPIGENTKND